MRLAKEEVIYRTKELANYALLFFAFCFLVFSLYVWIEGIATHFGKFSILPTNDLIETIIHADKSTLTFFIFFIFSCGLMSIPFKYKKVLQEESWTNQTSRTIKKHIPTLTPDSSVTSLHNIDRYKILEKIKKDLVNLGGVYAEHIKHLFQIYSIQKTDVSQNSLLANLENKLVIRSRTMAIYYMTTLAFVGTLYGIIVVFHNFSKRLVEIEGTDDFILRFREVLFSSMSGLDTAFYTTIVATFFGGIILYKLLSLINKKNLAILDQIETETATLILPFMNLPHERLIDDHALAVLENFRKALDTIKPTLEEHRDALNRNSDLLEKDNDQLSIIRNIVQRIALHFGIKND